MCQSIDDMKVQFSDYVVQYDDFQIIKSIGKGGFSEVFSATYLPTKQICAVKKLKAKEISGDKFNLFCREIEILSKCAHPFLLGFIGFTVQRPYIVVTEYLGNGSLYDALRWKDDHKPLNGTQKTLIAMGIASGMERIHKLGIIHRDLKSLNILLDNDYLPRIIDFGLSRFVGDEKEEFMTANVGTPHWMAPELFTSQQYTNKIDVYAYGMLLWEILTNSSPFKGKTYAQIMYDVCENGKRPAIPLRTPSAVKSLISKCWAQNPEERPTFHKIYKLFARGDVLFDGANKDEIVAFANKIKMNTRFKTPANEKKNPVAMPKKEKASDNASKLNNLININAPGFESLLHSLIAELHPKEAPAFYNAIEHHISPSTQPKSLATLFSTIVKLFSMDHQYYKAFINQNMHEKIMFYTVGTEEPLLEIYLYLFTNDPVLVSTQHIIVLSKMVSAEPAKILRLISILTTSKQFIINSPEGFWSATDILFSKSNEFIFAGCGVELISVIYSLYNMSAAFQNAKTENFLMILDVMLERGESDAEAALNIICSDPTIKFPITEKSMVSLIADPKLCDKALIALTKMDIEPTDSILDAMLAAGKTSQLARLVLCERSMNPTVAFLLANNGSKWLNDYFPDIESSMRMLMVIVNHQNARDVIPIDVAKLLCIAANTTGEVFDSICPILTKMTITSHLREALSKAFLDKYYATSFQKGVNGIISALTVTDKLARSGYCEGFITLLPYLKKMIENKDWADYALSTLAEISVFDEMKQPIIDAGFLESLEALDSTKKSVFLELLKRNIC